MCGDKLWPLADQKTVSLLYLSIGIEGRRILNYKNLHTMIDTLTTAEFEGRRRRVHKTKKHHFDRHVFLITKQLRGETVENFYGKIVESVENCQFENKEETLLRDVFITNLIDPEIQKQLLKQTVETRQARESAINVELGMQNQHQIQQHNKTLIPASVNAIQYPPSTRFSNWSISNTLHKQENSSYSIFEIFGEIGSLLSGINASQKAKTAINVVC